MALRNQPYLPLYVQDYLTDEKLRECEASSVGVYSFILCVMHKSEIYGTIMLKQKDKQTDNQIKNFAYKLTKHLPYNLEIIEAALINLLNEKILTINSDFLIQKRMVKDNEISEKRAISGKKGGEKSQEKRNKKFGKAKTKANTENEIEIENIIEYLNKSTNKKFKSKSKNTISHINARLKEGFTIDDFKTVIDNKTKKWLNDEKMSEYLRPETLFGNKFESYLNDKSHSSEDNNLVNSIKIKKPKPFEGYK